ncbi:uncharacterized protein G2W53_028709 [Senna tora]|uniref:Helitron helicase-like domain-containing protein n=1 Tax=Senna tora TaxID=362788 RepID=A0A834T4M4_9FABA|nr:uncharacterized protein G2W53_028709 [Senna tora]
MGGKIDHFNNGKGPYVFRLNGQNMHLMGGLLPYQDERPKFSQLYIYDTDNEVSNRLRSAGGSEEPEGHDASIVMQLAQMLDSCNPLVKVFRSIRERAKSSNIDNLRLSSLTQALARGESMSSAIGKRIILPSSFVGGERYSRENFQDAMTICTATDRPDILTRVFKIKLNALWKDITKNGLFGKCRAGIYTIEFQKSGLPHAHILIWLCADEKFNTTAQIDTVISAEIPNPETEPRLYEAVKTFMIHGPCGSERKSSPCMVNNKCSKHFPKKFTDRTLFDQDGYAKYCHRDNGHKVIKNGIELDNRFVVPYNRTLLLHYQAHINVEFCNQSRSIKYLFKYVSKGHDKVIAALSKGGSSSGDQNNFDEIKMYYDCRYISACEAAWRIFGFDINYREPSVEHLPFHLPNEQGIIFNDDDPIEDVVNDGTIKETKFLAWFEANKRYPKARCLTYAQLPTEFVFKPDSREWHERKFGYSIGRLYYVPPGHGELNYLRVLLTFTKGETCYVDIRTINGVVYPTFKDACYAMGILDDDKEYIEGIVEASN